MVMHQKNSETKVAHAPGNFCVLNHPLPFSPLVHDENGLVLAINLFALERQYTYSVSWRTAEKDCLILAEWYDYLKHIGVPIFQANEAHLKSFLIGGGQRSTNVRVHPSFKEKFNITKTNANKMRVILLFYRYWMESRGKTLQVLHGRTLGNLSETLFSAENGLHTTPMKYAKSEEKKGRKKRATPNEDQVLEVIDTAARFGQSETAEKYYLIASLMAWGGFRAGGCSTLKVASLFNGLRDELVFRRITSYKEVLKKHYLPENRRIIKQALKEIQKSGRKLVFCEIEEKTGFRHAPIPIKLLLEILDYVWTTRADFVRRRFKKGKSVPDNVFLSNKNRSLSQEAISNRLGLIFGEARIPGSGHMLRHAFCQEIVRNLYLKDRALHGPFWQASLVLENARQMMGHKNVTTVQPYLDRVEGQELNLEGEPIVVVDPQDAAMLRSLNAALQSDKADSVRASLRAAMEQDNLEDSYEPWREYAAA
ncbi:site-specific integrase [Ensifer adhaerens]|uniref:site-specific integrase n=1 Tax=Ensifer adhaerens TaxID=106592 RepID=UPI00132EF126|nr:site-specific integrase [Ensifer adhaerens]QHG71514.1 site-specific integrase [Ensifer adhaerens]